MKTPTTSLQGQQRAVAGRCAGGYANDPARGRRGPCTPPTSARAFSLIEILVVVGLLSVIILGLVAMFGQTQRAFRTGLAQSDVLEAGRAAADFLARDVAQTRPSFLPGVTNFHAWIPLQTPLKQNLPGGAQQRTNFLMDLFFLSRENQRWTATGYTVRDAKDPTQRPADGVGTLYRHAAENLLPENLGGQADLFLWINQTNFSRVADGVVHFRVRAFDPNGNWITNELPNNLNFHKSDVRWSTLLPGEIGLYVFKSNAVPAALEIELGFLEVRAWERLRAMPNATLRMDRLREEAGRVHIFRQRVTIPAVETQAYQ